MSTGLTVHARLIGGPPALPAVLTVDADTISDGRLKVPLGTGYEHFILQERVSLLGYDEFVFVWDHRTRIAE